MIEILIYRELILDHEDLISTPPIQYLPLFYGENRVANYRNTPSQCFTNSPFRIPHVHSIVVRTRR
ncbi:predicted protein [Botrytis cinerea T4]|uniref:Uncharacterized protein n=1 Tax=Botryotinia fuckeliana (strain T4) TaxID=999810 RepID=G2YS95_BOTF4|nr:predicted protein [Botrytis cinerea T4]